jgi:hypothetical protein
MNMRLRAASIDQSSRGTGPADVDAPIRAEASAQAQTATPLPRGTSSPLRRQQMGHRKSKLSELTAKIVANRKAHEARIDSLASRHDDVEKRLDSVLATDEAELTSTEQEVQELQAALKPQIGDNGGPSL